MTAPSAGAAIRWDRPDLLPEAGFRFRVGLFGVDSAGAFV